MTYQIMAIAFLLCRCQNFIMYCEDRREVLITDVQNEMGNTSIPVCCEVNSAIHSTVLFARIQTHFISGALPRRAGVLAHGHVLHDQEAAGGDLAQRLHVSADLAGAGRGAHAR